jgi:TPP-dependent pyruvate/acetoin dehydrogenase alpha subunit
VSKANYDMDRGVALLRMMERIRAFELQAELAATRDGLVLGAIHLSIGQEACAAGIMAALRRDDLILSTHRGHGHTLAKGADPTAMMEELLGRAGGCCGGKGGSMHIADFGGRDAGREWRRLRQYPHRCGCGPWHQASGR